MRAIQALAIFVLLGAIGHESGALMLREETVICPFDGAVLKVQRARSDFQAGQYLDLQPIRGAPAPWPLPQCPDGFVIYKDSFVPEELALLHRRLRHAIQYI
jgi:hypothetical protein